MIVVGFIVVARDNEKCMARRMRNLPGFESKHIGEDMELLGQQGERENLHCSKKRIRKSKN